jgi:C4-dicarboxylate transporter DctQ subunit
MDRLFVRTVEWIIVACLAVMVAVTFVATMLRFVPSIGGLYWSEEITRYASIWMVFLAAGLGVRFGLHLHVDLIVKAVPLGMQRALAVFSCLVMLWFEGVLVYYGTVVTSFNMDQQATSLQFPMGLIYAAIPVGGAIMMMETVRGLLRVLQGGKLHKTDEHELELRID